jgi:hypothetical protein
MPTLEAFFESYADRDRIPKSRNVFPLSQLQKRAILAWCSRWGLLGILPNETLAVGCPTRWTRNNEPDGFKFHATTLNYARLNGTWHSSDLIEKGTNDPSTVDGELVQDEFDPYLITQRFTACGGVEISSASPDWLDDFYPDIPMRERNTDYFEPGSEAFWSAYGEPVVEFVRYAAIFRLAIDELRSLPEPSEDRMPLLNYFLAAGGEVLVPSPTGSAETRWFYPSLLSAFAKMACRDLTAGCSEHRCSCCGKPFISAAYQSKYCSTTCQWKDSKRRSRRKMDSSLRSKRRRKHTE